MVRNLMHIDGRDLKFELAADGTVHARLSLLAVAADRESRPLENMLRVYELKVAAGRLNEVIRDGALYTLDIPVPKPGAYHIRAAVRDESTGRLGSASQFLEIPDLNRTRLALASVVLEDADSGSPGLTTARRQFRRGGQLRYVCLIQNGRKQAAGPDLAARIRIVRDGAEIYSAPAEVAELEEGRRAVVGVLRLLDAITPGEYFMQVTAAERGRSKAGAERWADFEVLP